MPMGSVMVRIEAKSNEKVMEERDKYPMARGNLKKMKSSTHFTAGSMLWNLSTSKVVSVTQPCIPPAVANPSIAMCCMYMLPFQNTCISIFCELVELVNFCMPW